MAADPYEEFRRAVERSEEDLDLGRAALAVARAEYPQLDVAGYLARLDGLATEVAGHLSHDEGGPLRALAALNYVLFQKHDFRGNREDYFDARNSFLNEVLDRRTGIPITLSILYMEVARRVGLALLGVGFPGHFLVKYRDASQEVVIDAFNGGEIKTAASLQQLLNGLYGANAIFHPGLLEPITKRQILRRVLNNLKLIYLRQRDLAKALAALDRMMIAEPDLAEDLRERGYIYLQLEYYPRAAADFEGYLRLFPDAPDADRIKEQLADLSARSRSLH